MRRETISVLNSSKKDYLAPSLMTLIVWLFRLQPRSC
jgi:hypothetical protein